MSALVDAMAKAIKAASVEDDWARNAALAALKAMREQPLTDPMWTAGFQAISADESVTDIYHAMLQAAIEEAQP